MVCISVSPVVPIAASGELLPLWPFSDLLGRTPLVGVSMGIRGVRETDGCRMTFLFYAQD